MQLRESSNERETEPQAATSPIHVIFSLRERLEHPRQKGRIDTDAVVSDEKQGGVIVIPQHDLYAPVVVRVARGIDEQVLDDLAEANRVATDHEAR